jgi:cytochrome c
MAIRAAASAATACALLAAGVAMVRAQPESAQLRMGAKVYAENCAMCHGDQGQGGAAFKFPIKGAGHQLARFKTALGLFEYNQLLMPYDDPGKINDEQKWAVTALMLDRSGLLPAGVVLGPDNARTIEIRPVP